MFTRTTDAHCKINLGLDVLGKRDDGYHDLVTVMVKLRLADRIVVSANFDPEGQALSEDRMPEIRVHSDNTAVPTGKDNLVYSASLAYIRALAKVGLGSVSPKTIDIRMKKRIPMRAGLGGGSSDAASVIKTLHSLVGARAKGSGAHKMWTQLQNRLCLSGVALETGSDVPFFLGSAAAIARGRGEVLTPFGLGKDYHVVCVMPYKGLSTAEVFSVYGQFEKRQPSLNADAIRKSLETGDDMIPMLHNGLERAACALLPEITHIRQLIRSTNPLASCMSGSGSCVYGIYGSGADAHTALEKVKAHPMVAWCVATQTLSEGQQ